MPDWEESQEEEEDNVPPVHEFHTLEDIAPLQKSTDELPTWLVDKLDSSDPGFEPPKEITTDRFLELLHAAERSDQDDMPEEIAQAAADADLPDWLQDVVPPGEVAHDLSPQPTDSEKRKQGSTGSLPESWISDLEDEDTGTIADWGQPETGSDVPDWLSDFGESKGDQPETATGDEDEDEATRSGVFDMSEFGEHVLGGSDIPDWMENADESEDPEIPSISGIFQSEEFAQEVRDALENELPDWLTPESAIESEEEAEKPDVSSPTKGYSDWLDDVDSGMGEQEFSSEPPEPDSDWLNELGPANTQALTSQPEEQPAAEVEDFFADSGTQKSDDKAQTDDWLNELGPAYTAQLTPNVPESEESPDWLAELGPPQTSMLPDPAEPLSEKEMAEPLSDIFHFGGEGEFIPDWLEAPVPEPVQESAAADLPEEVEENLEEWDSGEIEEDLEDLPAQDEVEIEPDTLLEANPDWLDELSTLGPDAFTAELPAIDEEPEAELAVPESVVPPPPTFSDDDEPLSEFPEIFTGLFNEDAEDSDEEAPEVDQADGEPLDFGEIDEGEVPEWLTQLGLPRTDSDTSEYESGSPSLEDQIFAGDLPEWVASMRPDTEEHTSSLPGLTAAPLLEDDFSDIPENLGGADLPDWLGDAPAAVGLEETAVSGGQNLADIPDWLQFREGEKAEDIFGSDVEDVTGELSALLEALPQAGDPAARLAKADLPDWIKAMKPKELTPEGQEPEPEQPVQETGPLTGIRGVIAIEPVVAIPREGSFVAAGFNVTTAQQEQAALLRQIQAGLQEQARTISLGEVAKTSPTVRALLAVILLAAIFLGIFGPNMQRTAPMPTGVENAYNALEAAAGKNVLVAFEYTPAMAAELDTQAALLMEHLAKQGSNVITVSQYAAGLALAKAHTEQNLTSTLGFVPGEAIGLRELGACLERAASCRSLAGHNLDAEAQAMLENVGLIIILTGERASLVNWIEQVGAPGEVALVAGVTQALAPIAAPYAATDQLQGVVAGLPDTAVYAQLANAETQKIARQLNAQHMAQIVTVLLLLGGALLALFSREKQAS